MPIQTPWGPPSTLYHSQTTSVTPGVATATASGTPHTKGTWTQIIAALDYDVGMIGLITNTLTFLNGTVRGILMDVAIGSAGNEKIIAGDISIGGADSGATVWLPMFVPKGVRLSFRIQSSTASQTLVLMNPPILIPAGPHIRSASTCTTYGANTGTSLPTTVAADNAAWATPTEITASTTAPAHWAYLGIGVTTLVVGSASLYYRIMVGAAASEKVVVPVAAHFISSTSEGWTPRNRQFAYPVDIPTGSRVSVSGYYAAIASEYGVTLHLFS